MRESDGRRAWCRCSSRVPEAAECSQQDLVFTAAREHKEDRVARV